MSPPDRVVTPVLICHAGMRPVTVDALVAAAGGLAAMPRVPIDELVDTGQFADDVDAGNWGASHGEVWRRAREIRERLRALGDVSVIYAGGMPEVAHAIAFGAYLEEQWPVEFYDFHNGELRWPGGAESLRVEVVGVPRDKLTTVGAATIRVELSFSVADESVREFVESGEQVADIRIKPVGREPAPGLVRSQADVGEVRAAFRAALEALVENRPGLSTIHLFVAGPVSVCVAIGQELRLRNNKPVQTYRHRRGANGANVTTEALRLTATGPEPLYVPLTEEESQLAIVLRAELWGAAIRDVELYADRKAHEAGLARAERPRWYGALPLRAEFMRLHPFPALPPVDQVVHRPATVDNASFDREGFGFVREDRIWRINDSFSVRLHEKFPDEQRRRALARIFLLHEYLHEVHGITKESYREVGKFPNALEHADYMCDLYGILHELDLEAHDDAGLRDDFARMRRRIAELIELVIESFWVFELPAPLHEMEVRRIRRYMNWYWQRERVRRCATPLQLAAILARKPVVELAGLATRADGRRHYASLRRLDRAAALEMAIVLDSEQLFRIKSGVNTPLDELIQSIREHGHAAIQEFFRRAYAETEVTGHSLPLEADVP